MTRPTPETDSVIAANHENGWTGATGIEMLEELARQLERDRYALRDALLEASGYLTPGFWEIRPKHKAAARAAKKPR